MLNETGAKKCTYKQAKSVEIYVSGPNRSVGISFLQGFSWVRTFPSVNRPERWTLNNQPNIADAATKNIWRICTGQQGIGFIWGQGYALTLKYFAAQFIKNFG